MSWLQWNNTVWPTTDDEARITLYLSPPDAGCARQSWGLELYHAVAADSPSKNPEWKKTMVIELSDILFRETDWRRLSGLEIRADAALQEAHEFIDLHGRIAQSEVTARIFAPGTDNFAKEMHWKGHDYVLRFGAREGLCFPCELDAWLIPEDDYARETPESEEEIRSFGEGPPNLRMITRAVFAGGAVEVPRSSDPVPLAGRFLRDEIRCESFFHPTVQWMTRQSLDRQELVEMPGWRSVVHFSTRPEDPHFVTG
jgi:hypothetical protein